MARTLTSARLPSKGEESLRITGAHHVFGGLVLTGGFGAGEPQRCEVTLAGRLGEPGGGAERDVRHGERPGRMAKSDQATAVRIGPTTDGARRGRPMPSVCAVGPPGATASPCLVSWYQTVTDRPHAVIEVELMPPLARNATAAYSQLVPICFTAPAR